MRWLEIISKNLLSEKAGIAGKGEENSLDKTLKELFESFFPEKKFLGPRPTADGGLTFPVLTQTGTEHDLNELSSGEKEILYGYLRIRSSAPRDSIILLDEPELHLNPRLIRGLPEFYRKHLGEALQNQIWLVTHSDALLREAIGKPGFNVFHMLPCGADANSSQLKPLSLTRDLDVALTDLVGDLAAYRPGGKGLIFEGGGDSDFDKTFASSLFSEELRGINLISGSNKIRVKLLHEVLERAYASGDLPTKFYAVTDRDSGDDIEESAAVNRYTWDVYHIENYLLEPEIISQVLNTIVLKNPIDASSVEKKLNTAARQVVPEMINHRMRMAANSKLLAAIDLNFDPNSQAISKPLGDAVSRSLIRIGEIVREQLSPEALMIKELELREELERSLGDGTWLKKIPGRSMLRRFIASENVPISYEIFRNMILGRMATDGFKPQGMRSVIERIRDD